MKDFNIEKPKKSPQEKRKVLQDAQLDNVVQRSSSLTRKKSAPRNTKQVALSPISPLRLKTEKGVQKTPDKKREANVKLEQISIVERDYNNHGGKEKFSVPLVSPEYGRLVDSEEELEAVYKRFGSIDPGEVEDMLKAQEEAGVITRIPDTDEALEEYQTKTLEREHADKLKEPQQYKDTDWVNNIKPSKESPEGIFRKQWEDNPSIKLRRTNEHTDGSQDFMQVYKDGTADYRPANPFIGSTFKGDRLSKAEKKAQEKPWLARLKNIFTINPNKIRDFLSDVKAEKESLAEQLGWDEEAELEKQRQQYQESLKEAHRIHGFDKDQNDQQRAA